MPPLRLLALLFFSTYGLCFAADSPAAGFVPITPTESPVPPIGLSIGENETAAWQAKGPTPSLTFKPGSTSQNQFNGPVYLKITYLDSGYGRLSVALKEQGQWKKCDKFTNSVLARTDKWVTSYQRWSGTPDTPIEVRVTLEKGKEQTLSIAALSVQSEPCDDAHFQFILDEAWKRPYSGPSVTDRSLTTNLKGKIMAGYQGWFRTPNDPYDNGWVHWGAIERGQFSVDMWPDVSGIPESGTEKAGDLQTANGKPTRLFSSAWPEVVRQHFCWMREHNIDGVFLQRFLNGNTFANSNRPEWVLGNVREAANREGRLWAIEYDISGTPNERLLEFIQNDWKWLVDQFGLLKDPSYAHENGKPVVLVWGMPVPNRNIKPETANAVIQFLKNDPVYGGNYVIGGLPGDWKKLSPEWQAHTKSLDGAKAWLSKAYTQDVTDFAALKLDYYPHVWPGFSWSNLKHLPTGSTEAYTPRNAGAFYLNLLEKTIEAKADRLFVGMLDEYDEGTAILPMSDSPPPTPRRPGTSAKFFPGTLPSAEGKFVGLNPPKIDLPLNDTAPVKNVPATEYSIRFDGTLIVPEPGLYTFTVEGAEGDSATLSIGNKRLKVDPFGPGAKTRISIEADNQQPLVYRLDYQHHSNSGALRLFWESSKIPKEVIPESAYIDAWGRFLSNEGKPADWWLQLTGKWKEMRKLRQP
ncbi:MAG: PA14 domain-containing protein [Verrucomicrobiota bacterium]